MSSADKQESDEELCPANAGLVTCDELSRREVLACGSLALVGLSPFAASDASAAVTMQERLPLQAGDRFVVVGGAQDGELLRPELLVLGATQIEGFPITADGKTQRNRNRLNRVIMLRLDEAEMDEATRARSADGVLIYSAVCTHQGCTIQSWKPEVRHFRCHCHLSEFAALAEGGVRNGPARKPLAMVPLALDGEGFVVATGGFNRSPGFKG